MIRNAAEKDFPEWLRLRKLLYPEDSAELLQSEIAKIYHEKSVVGELDYFVLVYSTMQDKLAAFIETSLRARVQQCNTSPVGYIESLYVDKDYRNKGIATELVNQSEHWVRTNGCSEFVVDTDPEYTESISFYRKLRFRKIRRSSEEVLLKKTLKPFIRIT